MHELKLRERTCLAQGHTASKLKQTSGLPAPQPMCSSHHGAAWNMPAALPQWAVLASNPLSPPFSLSCRSASFSQGTRASFLMRSDTAVQRLAQGNGHCVNGVSGQVHDFYSLPKPSRHNAEFRDSTYDLPRSLASHGHTKSSLTGSETDNEEVYTFKTPSNTLCREFGDLLVDNMDVPATPLSAYQIPRTFTLDKNHNALAVATPGDSGIAPPPRPPKPSQAETPRRGSPQQRPPVGENSRSVSAAATIPRRNTLPAMDNSRLHRGQCQPSPRPGGEAGVGSAQGLRSLLLRGYSCPRDQRTPRALM